MDEICFNLWYYLDHEQRITSIAAKAYLLDGMDDEKGSALLSSSRDDYHSIPPHRINPVHYSELQRVGVEEFFAPEFQRIQDELPKGASLPEDKLFFATPLFDFGHGFEPAEIGNGFIRNRD